MSTVACSDCRIAHDFTLASLRPYERQQGGYWLYGPHADLYGNGKLWVRAADHDLALALHAEDDR